MTERADGFWWVRVLALDMTRAWRPLWLRDDSLYTHDPDRGGEFVAVSGWVPPSGWGPYLGKEPGRAVAREAHGGVEVSMDGGASWPIWVPEWQVERDKVMEAKRAATYDPTADHEGEQTRAIDGAGVSITMPSEDGGPPWSVSFDCDEEA